MVQNIFSSLRDPGSNPGTSPIKKEESLMTGRRGVAPAVALAPSTLSVVSRNHRGLQLAPHKSGLEAALENGEVQKPRLDRTPFEKRGDLCSVVCQLRGSLIIELVPGALGSHGVLAWVLASVPLHLTDSYSSFKS